MSQFLQNILFIQTIIWFTSTNKYSIEEMYPEKLSH